MEVFDKASWVLLQFSTEFFSPLILDPLPITNNLSFTEDMAVTFISLSISLVPGNDAP